MHERPAIFGRHQQRFACRLPSGLRCFDSGSAMMYAAASLRVASGLLFGGRMGSSKRRDQGIQQVFAIKPSNHAINLPKLDIGTVDELPCLFNCRRIIGAIDIN
jgi:hypothetical protein